MIPNKMKSFLISLDMYDYGNKHVNQIVVLSASKYTYSQTRGRNTMIL